MLDPVGTEPLTGIALPFTFEFDLDRPIRQGRWQPTDHCDGDRCPHLEDLRLQVLPGCSDHSCQGFVVTAIENASQIVVVCKEGVSLIDE